MSNFKVSLPSGAEFFVGNGETILNGALKSGVVIPYSCCTGQCGVCQVTLLAGEVFELNPSKLIEASNSKILTCCHAPKTDIRIDAEDLSALNGIEAKTLPVRINCIKQHTAELIEVSLRLPPTAQFQFLSGQYLDVIKGDLRRSYSIATTQQDAQIKLFIKNYPNGKMSQYWFGEAKENDLLRIEGPKGTFFLRDPQKELVFLATGTGIAPIMSILQSLELNSEFEQAQPISVFWGSRNPEEFVWQPIFKRLNVCFAMVNSRPNETWQAASGYVQEACVAQVHDFTNVAVYACGSRTMIQSAKTKLFEYGLQENQFYSDAFVQSY